MGDDGGGLSYPPIPSVSIEIFTTFCESSLDIFGIDRVGEVDGFLSDGKSLL